MLAYIARRLLLIVPTVFGIMVINFIVIQAAPGGPVEQVIAQLQGHATDATARFSGTDNREALQLSGSGIAEGVSSKYRGAQGLDPELIVELERLYDPFVRLATSRRFVERFFLMLPHRLPSTCACMILFQTALRYFPDPDELLPRLPLHPILPRLLRSPPFPANVVE